MVMTSKTDSLTFSKIVGYGSADFGLNLFYTGLNLYLLFYYTDVIGLEPGVAGSIFMIALLWDAVTDPLMGIIASRTKSRFGSYRPYLLFAGPLLGLSFVMMFAAPLLFPAALALSCFISHLLFRTVYTVVAIPYASLSAAITRDSRTRTSLSGSRMQFATLAAISTAFLTPLLASMLGDGDLKTGYALTAVLFAVIAQCAFLATFWTVEEKVSTQPFTMKMKASFTALRQNKAFWFLFAATSCNVVATTVFTKSLVYYARYIISDANAVRDALTLYTIFAASSVLLWTWLAKRFSKQNTLMLGLAIFLLTNLAFYGLNVTTKPLFLVLSSVAGIGMAATVVCFWALLPDTVEYGEWKSTIRDEGIIFGLYQFAQKAASGFGVALVGFLLSKMGYVANTAQTEAVKASIESMNFLIPATAAFISLTLIYFYPIKGNEHAEILRDLDRRKSTL